MMEKGEHFMAEEKSLGYFYWLFYRKFIFLKIYKKNKKFTDRTKIP